MDAHQTHLRDRSNSGTSFKVMQNDAGTTPGRSCKQKTQWLCYWRKQQQRQRYVLFIALFAVTYVTMGPLNHGLFLATNNLAQEPEYTARTTASSSVAQTKQEEERNDSSMLKNHPALAQQYFFAKINAKPTTASNDNSNNLDRDGKADDGKVMSVNYSSLFFDPCHVSEAMRQRPLLIQSYYPARPARIPHPNIPHLSSNICQQRHAKQALSLATSFSQQTTKIQTRYFTKDEKGGHDDDTDATSAAAPDSILCFKAARTGSTFFTKTITTTLQDHRPTFLFWEPYGTQKACRGDLISTNVQSKAIQTLITQACRLPEKNRTAAKCTPDAHCRPLPTQFISRSGDRSVVSSPVLITALNARFLNPQLDWNRVFYDKSENGGSFVLPQPPHFIVLRRTNLVLMGYSKFHHGGCNTRSKQFDIDTLLTCVEHYALGDQELSSSVAFEAARIAGSRKTPHLILYEDVLANGTLVQKGLFRHLGGSSYFFSHSQPNAKDMFQETAATKKQHSFPLCEYPDVDCAALESRLLLGKYPCLWKQVVHANQGHAWSLPILPNGTIHVTGDCKPLRPWGGRSGTQTTTTRSFDELYQRVE